MKVRAEYAREVGQRLLKDLQITQVPVNILGICQKRKYIVDWSWRVHDGCDAVTFRNPVNGRYGIYLSEKHTIPQRYNFTIAHELSHCELGHFLDFDLSFINCPDLGIPTARALNREANICTEEILMPTSFIFNNYHWGFDYLKSACGVSRQAMEIRLKGLGLMGLFEVATTRETTKEVVFDV